MTYSPTNIVYANSVDFFFTYILVDYAFIYIWNYLIGFKGF